MLQSCTEVIIISSESTTGLKAGDE